MNRIRLLIKWIIGILVLGGTVGGIGWVVNTRSKPEEPPEKAIVRPVPTAEVKALEVGYDQLFPGVVRAERRVKMAFCVEGVLEELHGEEGRGVRQGEVLAQLDPRDYQHAFDVAKAKYEQAQRDWKRLLQLREKNAVSQAEYEASETAYHIAKAELRIHEKALSDTSLLAPFDGIIAKRFVENHEHVEAKQPVLSCQDISRVEVVIQMPESMIARTAANDLRGVQVCFGEAREQWFDATVCERTAESDRVTRTYDVAVTLARPSGLEIFPGMTATVKISVDNVPGVTPSNEDLTSIPVEALWSGPDGESYVWVIDPKGGRPEKRAVVTQSMRSDYVEVSHGLCPGERVAIAGLRALCADMLVRPIVAGKEGLDG